MRIAAGVMDGLRQANDAAVELRRKVDRYFLYGEEQEPPPYPLTENQARSFSAARFD